MRCGNCREVCPVFLETGHEAMVARGRVQLLKAFLEGQIELTDGLRDRIFACLNCDACRITCPCGIEVNEVILATRRAMFEAGKPLPDPHRQLRERLYGEQNPFGQKQAERGAWLPEKYRKPRGAPMLLHAGCAISYANNRVGKMILQILEMAGAEFTLLGDDEECCGDPILRMGDLEGAKRQRERNLAEYRKYDVETVVTPCAGCLKMFKHFYA
ncbi:MAG: (Fe-S)-binding protein, partial [Candidatus Sumerlaeia bacterium]|nr:(Fe-S)-binding protein [Candidatus Sumerlaeia bacterium]